MKIVRPRAIFFLAFYWYIYFPTKIPPIYMRIYEVKILHFDRYYAKINK